MSGAGWQDVVVALAAVGAAVLVLRRLVGFAVATGTPKCAGCETGACAPAPRPGAPLAAGTPPATPSTHPLVVVRGPHR